jgi:inosine-uridine nucleoside N-ribohydrolase
LAGSQKRRVLLDTDMSLGTPRAEIDDGAALIALSSVESVEIMAITTVHGNVDAELAMHNLQRLLWYMGRTNIALGMGAAQPLTGDKDWFDEWQAGYGRTPFWPVIDVCPPAAGLIVETIRSNPNAIPILAIGPLTNLAMALTVAPDIIPLVQSLIVMGGSFGSSEPEFNIRCDPEAAHLVLNAGWPVRMLGLEVTRQVFFSRGDFAALPPMDPARKLLRQQAPGWIDRVQSQGWEQGGCALHDAVALVALLDEALFEWREASVAVDLAESGTRGSTTITASPLSGSSVRVATNCDVQSCYDRIWSLLSTAHER